ncbi:MAG: hypothetical protein AAGC92_16950 [Pseudomonadota bacterium]
MSECDSQERYEQQSWLSGFLASYGTGILATGLAFSLLGVLVTQFLHTFGLVALVLGVALLIDQIKARC